MSNPEPTTLGEMLRTARLARGLDLAALARRTRIPERHLAAFEAGDWRALPGPVYERGFLRLAARELGIDAHPLLERYDREAPAPAERPPVTSRGVPRWTLSGGALLTGGRLGGVALTMLAVGVIGYLVIELAVFGRTPQLRITDPALDLAEYPSLVVTLRGITEPNATVQVDGLRTNPRVIADPAGAFEVTVGLVPGANVMTLVASDPLTGRSSAPVRRTIIVLPGAGDAPSPAG